MGDALAERHGDGPGDEAWPGDRPVPRDPARGRSRVSWIAYVVPFLAGILNAIHAGTNAKLNETLGRPWWAAVFVCAISGAVVFLGVLATRERIPSLSSVTSTPWWAWVGTAIAGVPVITTLLFAGRLGGAAFNGLVITATMICSILLDHFGLLGFSVHHANLWRILGALVMLGGLALICVF